MAQAGAEARSRKERPQTLGGTVEAIDEDPLDLVRRLLLRRSALKLAIGLREGNRTRLRGISQMPEHPATDNRRQILFFSETATMRLLGYYTPRQSSDPPRCPPQHW